MDKDGNYVEIAFPKYRNFPKNSASRVGAPERRDLLMQSSGASDAHCLPWSFQICLAAFIRVLRRFYTLSAGCCFDSLSFIRAPDSTELTLMSSTPSLHMNGGVWNTGSERRHVKVERYWSDT